MPNTAYIVAHQPPDGAPLFLPGIQEGTPADAGRLNEGIGMELVENLCGNRHHAADYHAVRRSNIFRKSYLRVV